MSTPPPDQTRQTSFLRVVLPNTGWLWLLQLLQIGRSIVLLPLLTHYLTPRDYGVLAMAELLVGIVLVLGNWGFVVGFLRTYYSCHPDDRDTLLSTVLIAVSISSVLLIGSFGLASPWLAPLLVADWQQIYLSFLAMECVTAVFILLNSALGTYLVAAQRVRAQAIRLGFAQLTALITTIVLLVWFEAGLWSIFVSNLVREALSFILNLQLLPKLRPHFRLSLLREVWEVGWAQLPVDIGTYITWVSDRWLIQFMLPLSQLGLYSLGIRFLEFYNQFNFTFRKAWEPVNFQMLNDQADPAALKRQANYLLELTALVGLGVALFSREALLLLTAPDFHAAYVVVPLLAIGTLFRGLLTVPNTFFASQKRLHIMPITLVPIIIIQLILLRTLIPPLGIIGAAIGSSSAALLYTVILVCWTLLRRGAKLQLALERWVLITIVASALCLLGLLPVEWGLWTTLGIKLLAFGGFGTLIALLEREQLASVFRLIRQRWQTRRAA